MNNRTEQIMDIIGQFKQIRFSKHTHEDMFQGGHAALFCIFMLLKKGVEPTPSDISNKLNISRPSVTAMLNILEEKGYIERILNKDDRRKMYVKLTEDGNNKVLKEFQNLKDTITYIADNLGDEDSDNLIRILYRVIDITRKLRSESNV
jgi:DNA-binding MarR family transcriptional regulator